ncbi:probable protein phosphatase 2C 27 [Selaginella moellendorffii]|uniref:probable protein phosphatase 2C 27 n=1 Tax=Selaginella moellendorffii TaxID=88036 RepID=UPI000D1C8178|nr:probable protein phosphatase 2C 27 [Selaginella moellendorffii]|eukprot:XP_002974967.2 probable protein phosphatase 2C 27 [Selaginella moellendorffii]
MAAGADISQPVGALEQLPAGGGAAGASSDPIAKPPKPVYTATITACLTATTTTTTASVGSAGAGSTVCKCVSTVRLAMSEVVEETSDQKEEEIAIFVPMIRSGEWTDIGGRGLMEDAHVRVDDLRPMGDAPGAFYGVFDGHCGKDAALFVREHLLGYILRDVSFPACLEDAVRHGFYQTDHAFAEACLLDEQLQSGTTALTAFVIGRRLLVANVGDSRAVLSRRGKAVEMSRDHKPVVERTRIEALGGFVDDGYLNGQLAVARALGDWHMTDLKVGGPLISEPELRQAILTEEDEFLIIGCDGLWDVFTSQNAIDLARKELQQHNDPDLCSKQLVAEALRRNTSDNLTVVTVCFHADCPPRLSSDTRIRRSFSAEGLKSVQDFLNRCS